jgi:hypothetical protein
MKELLHLFELLGVHTNGVRICEGGHESTSQSISCLRNPSGILARALWTCNPTK